MFFYDTGRILIMDISYSEQEELWLSVLNLGLLKLMNDYKILERKDINTLSFDEVVGYTNNFEFNLFRLLTSLPSFLTLGTFDDDFHANSFDSIEGWENIQVSDLEEYEGYVSESLFVYAIDNLSEDEKKRLNISAGKSDMELTFIQGGIVCEIFFPHIGTHEFCEELIKVSLIRQNRERVCL